MDVLLKISLHFPYILYQKVLKGCFWQNDGRLIPLPQNFKTLSPNFSHVILQYPLQKQIINKYDEGYILSAFLKHFFATILSHLFQIFYFHTPVKTSKSPTVFNALREYRNVTLGKSGKNSSDNWTKYFYLLKLCCKCAWQFIFQVFNSLHITGYLQ